MKQHQNKSQQHVAKMASFPASQRKKLGNILEKDFEPFTNDLEQISNVFAVFRIPTFNDYNSLREFMLREESPFESKSNGQLHFSLVLEFEMERLKDGYDWVKSSVQIRDIFLDENNQPQTTEEIRYIPLWLTTDWRILKKDVQNRILGGFGL